MKECTVEAGRVRKGHEIVIEGVRVRVTKREKWDSTSAKITFEDAGYGLPTENYLGRQVPFTCRFFDLTETVRVWKGK